MENLLPRGLRNNNPLNLRISQNAWLGKVYPNTDGAFEQFTSVVYGIRAAMVNARTLLRRLRVIDRQDTVANLIRAWAPPHDHNDTPAYIKTVCRRANIEQNATLEWKDKESFINVIQAMSFVECGRDLDRTMFEDAYKLM